MNHITINEVEKNGLEWLESHNKAKELRNKAAFAALDEAISKKSLVDRIAEFKRIIL